MPATSHIFASATLMIASFIGSSACQSDTAEFNNRGDKSDEIIDRSGDCQGICGSQASTGCFCDDSCSDFGDCCSNKAQVCDQTSVDGGVDAATNSGVVELTFDFADGTHSWIGDFADFPPGDNVDNQLYQLEAELRTLPSNLGTDTAFYIQGNNASDDLFMYLKHKVQGLQISTDYSIGYQIAFASAAQSGCVGVGGSPGESVAMVAGGTTVEPTQTLDDLDILRINLDKNNAAGPAQNASPVGDVANGQPCDLSMETFLTINRTHTHPHAIKTDADGVLWLIIGTDSGFEALTALFYQQIKVTLTPSL